MATRGSPDNSRGPQGLAAPRARVSGRKAVYAQKGIVLRVEVPQEIWAGESRPICAVLNGPYNDGDSKAGDVPWTYAIEWLAVRRTAVRRAGVGRGRLW